VEEDRRSRPEPSGKPAVEARRGRIRAQHESPFGGYFASRISAA